MLPVQNLIDGKWYHKGYYRGIPAIFCNQVDCAYFKVVFVDNPHNRIPSDCPDCTRRKYHDNKILGGVG